MNVHQFLSELKRRRVFRVVVVYATVAFVTVQVADIVFPALRLPEWTVTLVVVLAILGFPLTFALAWIFDVTPEGIERTGEGEWEHPSASAPRERSDAPVEATPASVQHRERAAPVVPRTSPSSASVAVLPFVNLSSDPEQEYFSDGLTEELLTVLAQVPGLRVPARTSSFAFKGQNTDIREIGERLAVRTVLEGSVRKSGARVRITAQLISVEDGYHLWSDTYDRDLRDIFALQDEIARNIVQTLKGRLLGKGETPQVKEATSDPEAYQLFLKGRHFFNRFSVEGFRKALSHFEKAVERDVAFARAWAGVATASMGLAYFGAVPTGEALPRARSAAERALALEPELADGYVSRGMIASYQREFAAAEQDLQQALELNPTDARAHNAHALLLTNLCRPAEAIPNLRRAAELDPLWLAPPTNLGRVYEALGRHADALDVLEQALDLAPTSGPLSLNIAGALSRLGRHEEAIARARAIHARQLDSHSTAALAVCLFRAEESAEAKALLEELERLRADGKVRVLDLVELYGWLGRRDEAFAALEAAVAAGEPLAVQLASDSGWDPLRDDPRWEPLLARAGFPHEVIRRSRELHELRRDATAELSEAQRGSELRSS